MDLDDSAEETRPLLQASNAPPGDVDPRPDLKPRRTSIVLMTVAIIIFLEFGAFMSMPAQMQIFENIICQQLKTSVDTDNETGLLPDPCKSEPVQSELGFVLGWKDTFQQIPGILLAIPVGILADRWGRKPVLFLGLVSVVVVEILVRIVAWFPEIFPLRLVWACYAAYLFGGGDQVTSAVLFTIISDTFSAMERTTVFFYASAAMLIAEVFAAPLGAALVELAHPWIAYWIGLLIQILCLPFALMIPETLPALEKIFNTEAQSADDEAEDHRPPTLKSRFNTLRARAGELPQIFAENKTIIIGVLVFFVSALGRQTTQFLVLYASKRFDWRLAQAAYIYSLRSAINVALLAIFLPFLSHIVITRFHFSANYKDLFLSRLQIIGFLLPGSLFIALAPNPTLLILGLVIYALGSGFSLTARSLVISLVHPRHFAALNSACNVSQGIGVIVAGPLLASAWHSGLVLGGWGLGMPFFVAAGLFALTSVVLAFVTVDNYASPVEAESTTSFGEDANEGGVGS